MAKPTVSTLTLGPVLPSETYRRWLADPEVTRYLEAVTPLSIKSIEVYIKAREQDSIFKGIYLGTWHIGNIKAGPVDYRHQHADIGIMIGEKQFWGKGFGAEAIRQMVELCRGNRLHMVTAGIIEGNIGSQKAFLKNGFKEIGRFPQFRWFEGEWRDEIIYGLILSTELTRV